MNEALKHIDPDSLNDVASLRSVLTLVLQALEPMSKENIELKEDNPLEGCRSFGPSIRGLLHLLHYECNVTQGYIGFFCDSLGLDISSGSIGNILKSRGESAVLERGEILSAGIAHSSYVQADSTSSKEKGVSLFTQIFCSPLFDAYI